MESDSKLNGFSLSFKSGQPFSVRQQLQVSTTAAISFKLVRWLLAPA